MSKRVSPKDKKALIAAARRGARFLDQKDGEWWNDIPLGKLEMECGKCCILGHHVGGFEEGLSRYGLTVAEGDRLGFNVTTAVSIRYMDTSEPYSILAEAWAAEVYKRQLKGLRELNR